MLFEINPTRGVNQVEFGASPDAVRKSIGSPAKPSASRAKSPAFPADYFADEGLFAYYSAQGVLEALEFARPAEPVFHGANFLGMPFSQARDMLRSIDPDIEEDADSVTSHRCGVGVWAPLAKDEPAAPCESVIAFCEGYYVKS
jgi:hypothetical protein